MLVGLTVIVNPLLGATAYTTLTSGSDRASRQHTARLCALTVGAVLSVAALGGEALLRLFNIGLPEFQVGGGILLLLIAISMVFVVRCGDEVRCAKVYKEAHKRSFRQAVAYTEGRKVKNSRQARAMLVSHDRSLLRSVCDEFWLVSRGGITPFDGDMDDYQRYLLEEAKRARQAAAEERRVA